MRHAAATECLRIEPLIPRGIRWMHARAERREADGPVPRVDDAIEIHQVA